MDRDTIYKVAHVSPSERQYAWQAMEFTAFIHFGINTFTDREWGTGHETPKTFHPTNLDTDQWCKFLADNGFKLAILTVKHHEGFCLWQTRYTKHSVASSDWRGGQGDVMADFVASCKKYGIKAGLYLSPADLYQMESEPGFGSGLYGNESKAKPVTIPTPVPEAPPHKGSRTFEYELDDYNAYFMNQLYELLTEYGEISEIWFDGAHPARKGDQQYNKPAWGEMIRALQPSIIIHGDGLGEMRWVGNELGFAREAEWNPLPVSLVARTPWRDEDLGSRAAIDAEADTDFVWMPAETDVSIRPGWFYHTSEDDQVKSPEHLFKIYLESIGRNTTLLLNYPPDPIGVIHHNDVKHTEAFMARLREALSVDAARDARVNASHAAPGHTPEATIDGAEDSYWTVDDGQETAEVEWTLATDHAINLIVLQEAVTVGQRVEGFELQAWVDDEWQTIGSGSTIGYKRVVHLLRPVTTGRVRLLITASRFAPTLKHVGMHYYREPPAAPKMTAEQGRVVLSIPSKREFRSRSTTLESAVDTTGYEIRFTTDGSPVTVDSPVYTESLAMISGEVRAKSFVKEAGALSESSESYFKVPYPHAFMVVHEASAAVGVPLVMELRDEQMITGFAFTPTIDDTTCLVERFHLEISGDGQAWTSVYADERFDNIENDPTRRERSFEGVRGRFVRFTPLAMVGDSDAVMPAMLDVFVG